jgi:hypothetical protein
MFALAFLAGVWNVSRTGGPSDSSALYPAVLNLTVSARDGDGAPTRLTSVGGLPAWSITAGAGADASRGELTISLDDAVQQRCQFDFAAAAGSADVFVSVTPECTWMLSVPPRGVFDSSSSVRHAVTWSLNVAGGVVVAARYTAAKGRTGFWQTVRFVGIIVVVATVQIGTRWFIKKQRSTVKTADMARRREANIARIAALRKSQSALAAAPPQTAADATAGAGAEGAEGAGGAGPAPPPTPAPGSSDLKTE